MATYAIGDIQGCFDELSDLLLHINFTDQDELWFAGDLVNRGPKSLETLRFIKSLGKKAKVVLGNHDLHLLAVHYTTAKTKRQDTLQQLLAATDCDDLMDWLRHQPLLHFDPALSAVISHAGIPPFWTIEQSISRAREVETVLQSNDHIAYLTQMYGNSPALWREELQGIDRLRCITNYLTRMRFCDSNSKLDLTTKGEIGQQPNGFKPWFEIERTAKDNTTILFGHWAAIMGHTGQPQMIAVDTGCVWGEKLSAICLENHTRYSVPSQQLTNRE